MRRILYVLIFVVVAVSLSSCSATEQKTTSSAAPTASATTTPSENVEQAVAQMERDWAAALLKRDVATIERIVADDFIGLDGDGGTTFTKASHLEEVKTGVATWESANVDNIKVRVFGDTAVVTVLQTQKSKYKGKDNSGRYPITDIFVRRNGKWQIVAEHLNTIKEPKKL
jgi:ketosteroid isomerase-like protein